jgi:hypothetical protein
MIKENVLQKTMKFVVRDILIDLIYWFFWWYTSGLKKAFLKMIDTIVQGNRELGLSIWIKNIFRPMFGQYDWQGRIISFFMRIFMIIIRFFIFIFWIIFALIVFLFWIVIPLFIIFMIMYNTGLFGEVVVR